MAQKRMFAMTIIDSDAFLSMPQTSQNLYFHLSMRADDDGFVNKPKSIIKMIGCNEDDLKLLIMKKFILPFDSGVIVIKHWKIHNYIQKDRYIPTKYQDEKARLELDENNSYRLLDTECIQVGHTMDTQYLDLDLELDIDLDKNKYIHPKKPLKDTFQDKKVYGEFENVILTDSEFEKLEKNNLLHYIEKLSIYIQSTGKKYKSHYATILSWSRNEPKNKNQKDDPVPEWYHEDYGVGKTKLDEEERIKMIEKIKAGIKK